MNPETPSSAISLRVRGLVQGVGFRPMVWRLANEHGLNGQVLNDGEGVLIDLCGAAGQLERFLIDLPLNAPPLACIDSIEQRMPEAANWTGFKIVASRGRAVHTGVVPDAASCDECITEIFDPGNRRYRYPFTNCTHCGPRLSIINAIPYDRANTSMAPFVMCPECQAEYDNPADRRFHAQPNACVRCGPKVWLEPDPGDGYPDDALNTAQQLLKEGQILAIKGLGGFHLACDATNVETVARLRERKHRYAKPLALMARDLDIIRRYCEVNEIEATHLRSAQSPIVLLRSLGSDELADEIAPGQRSLGFMLPYTPLHHLLLTAFEVPLVMTSGNDSDAPQCIDNDDAKKRLSSIADYWLLNDREIRNRVDDSVLRVVLGQPQLLRRARGYTPTPIKLPKGFEDSPAVLALGGELKNTFCLIKDDQAILSQHIGDLEDAHTFADYEKNLDLFDDLFRHHAAIRVIDAHPEYLSSKRARAVSAPDQTPLLEVYHHHAHIAACLAENQWPLSGPRILGISLDGLGYGQDGEIWGGEFLLANYVNSDRLASFKPVALPGGTRAMQEPWRNTYAHLKSAFDWPVLLEKYGDLELFQFLRQKPLKTLDSMLEKHINSPLASSCGRLFDAVSAALGICREQMNFEGQAAMELENMVDSESLAQQKQSAYPFHIDSAADSDCVLLEPRPMWVALLSDLESGISVNAMAARFHLGLASAIVNMADYLAGIESQQLTGTIALSGGVFQNRILFEHVKRGLQKRGFTVLNHSLVPANDGGIALGQALIALARTSQQQEDTSCAWEYPERS